MAWIDMTNELTPFAIQSLEIGQVLMYEYEGSPLHIKIMRKKNGKVWGKQLKVRLMKPDEVQWKDKLE